MHFWGKVEMTRYDVTDYVESIFILMCMPCFGWNKKTMILGDQEICAHMQRQRPFSPVAQTSVGASVGMKILDFLRVAIFWGSLGDDV